MNNRASSDIDVADMPLLQGDTCAKVLVTAPVSSVNPLDASWPEEIRSQILGEKYREVTLKDAITTGNTWRHEATGAIYLRSNLPEASFKGFVFEAAVARLVRTYMLTVGKQMFAWCTYRSVGHVSDAFISQYTAFVAGDKSLKANRLTAILYSTTSPFDVQFYRRNSKGLAEVAQLKDQAVAAGIQIKAITGNEKSEIILPILSGAYRHVLTLLKHPSGRHSFDVCHDILHGMVRTGEINFEQFYYACRHIARPDMLGIDQQLIDEYSVHISQVYIGQATWDKSVYEAITLEVSLNLSATKKTVLRPVVEPIALPDQAIH